MSCCSGSPLIDFEFESPKMALDALCAHITPIGTEQVGWRQAMGRVLARDAVADRQSPSCDVSAMDGYALRLEDCASGKIMVSGEVAIGREPQPMPYGQALQIVTGAPVPMGVGVVIKREDVIEGDGVIELSEQFVRRIKSGANIRRAGENMPKDAVVQCARRVVTSPMMGMLTGYGIVEPVVYKQVRVGVITTGNEVVAPDQTPDQWQLRDSNASSLIALCDQHRWVTIEKHIHAHDTVDGIRSAADELIQSCDAIVFTGGVSMGDHDHVPEIVAAMGAEIVFHKLPQRPGKPALGAVLDGKSIFGLPGNPVSVMVTAHRLLIPALAVRAGIQTPIHTPRMMSVVNSDDKTLGIWWSRLARIVSHDSVELITTKGSGDVPSSAMSDGFVELAPGQSGEGPWAFWSWLG